LLYKKKGQYNLTLAVDDNKMYVIVVEKNPKIQNPIKK
jgi:hypothetical protein